MRAYLSLGQLGLELLTSVQQHQVLGRATTAAAAAAAATAIPSRWWQARSKHDSVRGERQQEDDAAVEQHKMHEVHTALQPLGCSWEFVEKLFAHNRKYRPKLQVPTAPAVLHERISNLLDITRADTGKQQQALYKHLRAHPGVLYMQPATLLSKASMLQQEMQQQLNLEPELVQRLIGKHPTVLAWTANSLTDKMVSWCELLALQPAEVLALWTRNGGLTHYSTQLLAANLAGLQDLLQLHMPPAKVIKMSVAQPRLLQATRGAVMLRLDALQECLADWTPQQLGAALLKHPSVLNRSPDTIRYMWRVVTKYREMCMLGTQQHEVQHQQQQQQQQQQHKRSHEAPNLGIFTCTKERYAMLEYIMEQLLLQWTLRAMNADDQSHESSPSNSSSTRGLSSHDHDGSEGGACADHVPPFLIVLRTKKHLFEQLVLEHYPGFRQWYKQRQQAAKEQHRPPDSDQKQ